MQENSYPLPNHRPPALPVSAQIEDLKELLALLDAWGVETQNTRIARYLQYFEAIEKGSHPEGQTFFKNVSDERFRSESDWYLYALREVHERHWITRGLRKRVPRGSEDKLKEILSGSDFAALDKKSQYRNIQFELRIASYFCQSNYDVDLTTDTDIIVRGRRNCFYLECKRVSTMPQLRKRITEAVEQLNKRLPDPQLKPKCFGIVAIDVTKIAFSHNGLTFGVTPDHSRDVIREKLVEISKLIDDKWFFDKNDRLILYWLQIHIPAITYSPPAQLTRFSSFLGARDDMSKDAMRAFIEFDAIFRLASSTPDKRQVAGTRLRHRRRLDVPKGARFGLDDDLLEDYLQGRPLGDRSDEDIVASLQMHNETHEFSMWEFRLLAANIPEETRNEYAEDVDHARLKLVLDLYCQRHPFEEDSSVSIASHSDPGIRDTPRSLAAGALAVAG